MFPSLIVHPMMEQADKKEGGSGNKALQNNKTTRSQAAIE